MIQTLWYATIQEATRLGWWHKEPAESLDLARGAGFFPGLIQERAMLEGVRWSIFSCQHCIEFSFNFMMGLCPYKLNGRSI